MSVFDTFVLKPMVPFLMPSSKFFVISIYPNFKNNGAQTWSKHLSCVKASVEYARAMIFPSLLIYISSNAASECGLSIFSRCVAPLRHITHVVY